MGTKEERLTTDREMLLYVYGAAKATTRFSKDVLDRLEGHLFPPGPNVKLTKFQKNEDTPRKVSERDDEDSPF